MNLAFKYAIINKETDFTENGIDKINVNITVICDLIGANNTNEIGLPLTVINLNSQTGEEMDNQRTTEINNFILNY